MNYIIKLLRVLKKIFWLVRQKKLILGTDYYVYRYPVTIESVGEFNNMVLFYMKKTIYIKEEDKMSEGAFYLSHRKDCGVRSVQRHLNERWPSFLNLNNLGANTRGYSNLNDSCLFNKAFA